MFILSKCSAIPMLTVGFNFVNRSSQTFTDAFFMLFFHDSEPQNAGLVDDKKDLN